MRLAAPEKMKAEDVKRKVQAVYFVYDSTNCPPGEPSRRRILAERFGRRTTDELARATINDNMYNFE